MQVKTQAAAAPASACRVCGRPLTNPISIEIGIDPLCRIKQKNETMLERTLNIFGSRANYTWSKDGDIIAIVDFNGPGPSVTNDIRNVLRDIAFELAGSPTGGSLQDYRIIYRDSSGIWDGVHVLSTGEPRFYSIGEKDYQLAKAKLS